jgi:hypothetical protein
VHVTDLHATLLGLAAVPFTTNPAPNSQYATTKTRRQLATSEEEVNGEGGYHCCCCCCCYVMSPLYFESSISEICLSFFLRFCFFVFARMHM